MKQYFLAFQTNFLGYMRNLFGVVKQRGIVKTLASVLVTLLLLLSSGYAVVSLDPDSFTKTLMIVILFCTAALIFVFYFDKTALMASLKRKRLPFAFILILLFAFSTILTMLASGETNDLLFYAAFGMLAASGFIIAHFFDFKSFVKGFSGIMYIVCLVSLFFYFFYFITRKNFSPLPVFSSRTGTQYANFFYLSFQNTNSIRLQGPFWEPGLFSSMLVLALALEICFLPKINWKHFVLFSVANVLTFSTFGYVAYLLILLLLVKKLSHKKTTVIVFCSLAVALLILFIVFYKPIVNFLSSSFPAIFGKLSGTGNESLTTRLYCPYVDLLIFIKSPFFGVGMSEAASQYADYMASAQFADLLDSQTSTTFFMMAEFGVFGLLFTVGLILGVFKSKRTDILSKILLSLIILIVLNKEPHSLIAFDWVLLFILIKDAFEPNERGALSPEPSKACLAYAIQGQDDSAVVKRNVVLSFVVKGAALVIGFFSLPLYKNYFSGDSVLGVWLTILSVMAWVMTFDLGLGNGLKNKLVQALKEDDHAKIKSLISSTYVSSLAIVSVIFLIGVLLFSFLDLNSLFNISSDVLPPVTLKVSTIIVFGSICLEFVLKNVIYIYQALQKQAIASSFSLISSGLICLFTLIARFSNAPSQLLWMSVGYLLFVNLPLVGGNIIVFAKRFNYARPSFKGFRFAAAKSVMTLGIAFFGIQIANLILNSVNDLLISNIFGPSYTTIFNYYNKPFNMVYSLYSLVTLPYWAMVVKAKADNNIPFIKKMLFQMLISGAAFILAVVFLCVIYQPFVNLWIGPGELTVDWVALLVFAIETAELIFLSAFASVCNGLGIILPQVLAMGIPALLKIPLTYLLKFLFPSMMTWAWVPGLNVLLFVPALVVLPLATIKCLKKAKTLQTEAPSHETTR